MKDNIPITHCLPYSAMNERLLATVLLELADRILVICDGKVSGILDGRKANKQEVGLMMTHVGGKANEPA